MLSLLVLPTVPNLISAADEVEEVVAIGTRRDARSVGDSPAPVDVLTGSDLKNHGFLDQTQLEHPLALVNHQQI